MTQNEFLLAARYRRAGEAQISNREDFGK